MTSAVGFSTGAIEGDGNLGPFFSYSSKPFFRFFTPQLGLILNVVSKEVVAIFPSYIRNIVYCNSFGYKVFQHVVVTHEIKAYPPC